MGDLMTDEELKKILETSIQKAFFEPRKVIQDPGTYHARTIEKEPYFVELVRDHLKPSVEKMLGDWFRENEGRIAEMLDMQFKKGVVGMVVGAIDSLFENKLNSLRFAFQEAMQKMGEPR